MFVGLGMDRIRERDFPARFRVYWENFKLIMWVNFASISIRLAIRVSMYERI